MVSSQGKLDESVTCSPCPQDFTRFLWIPYAAVFAATAHHPFLLALCIKQVVEHEGNDCQVQRQGAQGLAK